MVLKLEAAIKDYSKVADVRGGRQRQEIDMRKYRKHMPVISVYKAKYCSLYPRPVCAKFSGGIQNLM